MNSKALWIVSLFVFLNGAAYASKTIIFPTYSPNDYSEILSGSFKGNPGQISGSLYMPVSTDTPVAAVVIMHGSGGIREDTEIAVANSLANSGVAAFVVNSFKGRGFSETGSDQGKLPMAATVLDAFQALLALRKQPHIDGKRIGVVGFSRGGVASLFTNQKPLQKSVLSGQSGFMVHAPIYPGCSTSWDKVIPTSAPVRFFLGENDDHTPAKKCLLYEKRINEAGGKSDSVVYPGVSHQFLIPKMKKIHKTGNFAECDLGIRNNGEIHYPKLGISVNGDWRGFVRKVFKDCGTRGFTQGGNSTIREKAIEDITKYLVDNLRK